MHTQFLRNYLGLRFLMSGEDRKFFCHYWVYAFFNVLFSLLTFDWSYPVLSFSPSPLFLSHWYLASVHLLALLSFHLLSLTAVAYTFYFSLHQFMWLFAFFASKKWCFLYAWNIKCRKFYFPFQTGRIRLNFLQNKTSDY